MKNDLYKIGVTLSGGGFRCLYHLGCLKALEEKGIKPDIISGSSSGSVVGALYADGYSPDEIFAMFKTVRFTNLIRLSFNGGIFNLTPFTHYLRSLLHNRSLESLPIPLRIVATDLDHGRSKIFYKGDVASCVVASCTFPVIASPYQIDGVNYVDGGVFNLFPVQAIRDKCEFLIGLNCSPLVLNNYKRNIKSIFSRLYNFIICENMLKDRELCDVLIETDVLDKFKTFSTKNFFELYDIGYYYTNIIMDNYNSENCSNSKLA